MSLVVWKVTEVDPTLTDTPLDMLVVPGLAFDAKGGRLGRGKGYYDRYISESVRACAGMGRPAPFLVGLCVEAQLLEEVPMEPSDRPLDALATSAATPGGVGVVW